VRFFCLKWFHQKYPTGPLIRKLKQFPNQKYPTGPLIRELKQFSIKIRIRRDIRLLIFFRSIGHSGKFGYELRAVAPEFTRYGPLRGMKPYSENL
jgi:hypothetical protein